MYSFLVCKSEIYSSAERGERGEGGKIIFRAFRLDVDDNTIPNATIEGLSIKNLAKKMINEMKELQIKDWQIRNYPVYPKEETKPLDYGEYGKLYTALSLAKL